MARTRSQALTTRMMAILVLLGTVMLVGGTDMTKVVVALPALAGELGLRSEDTLWVADSYPLTAGTVLVLCAVLADRFGRKRIYVVGLSLAVVSAALVGTAQTYELVLIGRMGQGIGAAMLIASTVAIIRVTFLDSWLRGVAYGVWVIGFGAGSAMGPLMGGALVELGGWPWVFWINVPVLLICLLAALTLLNESKNPDPPRLDLWSAVLAGLTVGGVITGLKGMAQAELPVWHSPAALAIGSAALVLFVLRQRALPRPFLDLSLFSNKLLASSAAVIAVTIGVLNGSLYLLTQRYQVVEELPALQAGAALLPLAASSAAGGLAGPVLSRWCRQQHIITAGMGVAAAGLLLLASGHEFQLTGMVLLGAGAGAIMAVASNALMSSAPEKRTADAGAIQESAFALGSGIGIAAMGTLALYYGAAHTPTSSSTVVYGAGVETALGLVAFLYAFFALGAGLMVLNTSDARDLCSQEQKDS